MIFRRPEGGSAAARYASLLRGFCIRWVEGGGQAGRGWREARICDAAPALAMPAFAGGLAPAHERVI